MSQVDEKLEVNAEFVQKLIDANPFPPPEDASYSARAPSEADHEVDHAIHSLGSS